MTTIKDSILVDVLRPDDRAGWLRLTRGYKAFYGAKLPRSAYDLAWQRLQGDQDLYGFCARIGPDLVGIVHYLFHANVWMPDVCYLQDLFVDKGYRGRGIARQLIDAVADAAQRRGAPRLYWQTKADNSKARLLYDKLGKHHGFIRYDYSF
jgi:ribosomal protein S18 acetylase RimI-like enzyme